MSNPTSPKKGKHQEEVDAEEADLEQIVELFHQWVADQSMPEMLIDIADYRHVPDGPGSVLVGLESDYAIDHAGGRYGLGQRVICQELPDPAASGRAVELFRASHQTAGARNRWGR